MATALIRHEEVPENVSASRIYFDQPARCTRFLVSWPYSSPKLSILQTKRIAPTHFGKLTQVPASEVEEFNAFILPIRHVYDPGAADLDSMW